MLYFLELHDMGKKRYGLYQVSLEHLVTLSLSESESHLIPL